MFPRPLVPRYGTISRATKSAWASTADSEAGSSPVSRRHSGAMAGMSEAAPTAA